MIDKIEKSWGNRKLVIETDDEQIFLHDPGMRTPILALLYEDNRLIGSGTLDCVMHTTEVDGYPLEHCEYDWLDSQTEELENWLDEETEILKDVKRDKRRLGLA